MSFIPQRVSMAAPPVTGASISGGGAAGRVAYFDSNTSITGVSTFTFDSTTPKVVVGSTTISGASSTASQFVGQIGVEAGAGTDTMVRIRGNSTTAGANQYGLYVDTFFSSAATTSGRGITSVPQTVATSYTMGVMASFSASGSASPGSSVTRFVNYLSDLQAPGDNNAVLADNTAFVGNWFINSTTTRESLFSGTMNISVSSGANLALTKINNSPSIKFEGGASNDFYFELDGSTALQIKRNDGAVVFQTDQSSQVILGGSGLTPIHQINTAVGTPGTDVMTMTNGPAGSAGNPAGFLKLQVNGATYIFPYWNFT